MRSRSACCESLGLFVMRRGRRARKRGRKQQTRLLRLGSLHCVSLQALVEPRKKLQAITLPVPPHSSPEILNTTSAPQGYME